MPRTPLFRVLQRSFRLARLSAETGRPPDEIVDEVRAARDVRDNAGLTRRQLLGGTAAAAGLALVGCSPFAPPPRAAVRGGGRRVVIIGAGISGLTAGYRLSQQEGFPSASSRGRTGSAGGCSASAASSPTARWPSSAAS